MEKEIEKFKHFFSSSESIKLVVKHLNKSEKQLRINGLVGSGDAFYASSVMKEVDGIHLFILHNKEEAAYFLNDLQALNPKKSVLFFPSSYRVPYQIEKTDNANVLMRAEVLNEINRETKRKIIVSYPEALPEKVVTKKHLKKNTLEIKQGETYSIDFINELLIDYEFEKVDFVYQPGQFAVRGGIVDVFSFSNDEPYRIEFFGDEVDSIRSFNPVDQCSVKMMSKINVLPNVQQKLLKESRESFLSYLPDGTFVWIKDYDLTLKRADQEFEKAKKVYANLSEQIQHLQPNELYTDKEELSQLLNQKTILEFGLQEYLNASIKIQVNQKPQPTFNKQFDLVFKTLKEQTKAGYLNFILAPNPKQVERFYKILEDHFESEVEKKTIDFTPIVMSIREGFIDEELKIVCFTDHQIFERFNRFRLKEGFRKNEAALTIKDIYKLKSGDYVTHIDHGVGQFSGLEKIEVNGKTQEAIRLKYKDNDILYVNIHSLHRIAKFSGEEGSIPKINKLGSPAWKNLKAKTKKKVKEVAFDLIQLYAKRKSQKGFAYSPDTYLQNELEASFIYEDTPDQLTTTEAVKKDMESESPMDRLVCGDVGFGKTEIAIRAAFKAVTDNKQVAILVPTTILSLQHYRNFSNRLKDFPCTVSYLNRFKSAQKSKETIEKLANGEVNIIVGTHRLLGKQIKFKDLGLIIIDEEQKFGVGSKDKLKTLKANVDTLTLTATPIPRTLQFSLMGSRDLSIIKTPPPNRFPVETSLQTFNEVTIRDAITYEITRGGQVYFVHNRVQNIKEVAGMIQRLCPGARVAIGHGQMDGESLEKIMMDFINGIYDVLVATTIIESGIDIPNANTMIINNAQNFGLSDLHQLRGRVGRSNKKAFCILLAPPMHHISTEARKRLTAITQFSDLGSGMNIAMRDLDIRGAGNLLGAEQSGFINEVGFDTYQKILNEAVQELKENEFKDLFKEENANLQFVQDCVIETDFELLIPDEYVNNITERLALYRKLDNIDNDRDLEQFKHELKDRFGEMPNTVNQLIQTLRLRWLAKESGFEKLVLKSKKLLAYFVSNQDSPYYQSPKFMQVIQYIQNNPQGMKMKERNEKLYLVVEDVASIEEGIASLEELKIDN